MWNICRTCMFKKEEMISIFKQDKSPPINSMIKAISSLEFLPSDTLPSQICNTCLKTLEMTYYFRKQLIRCNNELQKQAQTHCIALHPVKIEEKENDEDVYSYEHNENVPILNYGYEISTRNAAFNVGDPPSNCPEMLVSGDNATSVESDVKSLNFELISKTRGGDLHEESYNDIKVDSYFEKPWIKSEEVEIKDNGVQFENNCEIISEQIISEDTADDGDEFCPVEDLFLTESCSKSHDVQQNANENGEETEHISGGTSDLSTNTRQHTSSLNQHLRKHTSEITPKPHKCEFCEETFSWPSILKIHLRRHTGEKPFKCQYCSARFTRNSGLKEHIRMHTDKVTPKPHKCEICDETFSWPSGLKRHMKTETHKRPLKCEFCNARFTQVKSLNQHFRLHTEEGTPHKCNVCGKSFEIPSYLKIHMRTHSGERPFQCQHCNVKFTQIGSLNRHMRKHTGVNNLSKT